MARSRPSEGFWRPYVSVAERKRQAVALAAKLSRQGIQFLPVEPIRGKQIATTPWGRAWCEGIEGARDFESRLPRGKTYVRNGSVIDLQISPGHIDAKVSGSQIYTVQILVKPVPAARWQALVSACAGKIDSVVELLQGRVAAGVMQILSRPGDGLIPVPSDISMTCSCPDWATMCKHVAAVLYGVGHRLDTRPELLFTLRKVNIDDLVASAVAGQLKPTGPARAPTLDEGALADVFGIELDEGASSNEPPESSQEEPAPSIPIVRHPRKTASAKKPRASASVSKTAATRQTKKAPRAKAAPTKKPAATKKKPARAPAKVQVKKKAR